MILKKFFKSFKRLTTEKFKNAKKKTIEKVSDLC